MSAFTRARHMRWAKDRSLEYLGTGDVANARGSMLSDLGKHPETEGLVSFAMMSSLSLAGVEETRRWIEGFAE